MLINAVAPGPTKTAMFDQLPQSRIDEFNRLVFARRFAEPDEIAKVIEWLALDAPEYVNGACIDDASGGYHRARVPGGVGCSGEALRHRVQHHLGRLGARQCQLLVKDQERHATDALTANAGVKCGDLLQRGGFRASTARVASASRPHSAAIATSTSISPTKRPSTTVSLEQVDFDDGIGMAAAFDALRIGDEGVRHQQRVRLPLDAVEVEREPGVAAGALTLRKFPPLALRAAEFGFQIGLAVGAFGRRFGFN